MSHTIINRCDIFVCSLLHCEIPNMYDYKFWPFLNAISYKLFSWKLARILFLLHLVLILLRKNFKFSKCTGNLQSRKWYAKITLITGLHLVTADCISGILDLTLIQRGLLFHMAPTIFHFPMNLSQTNFSLQAISLAFS